MAVNILLLRRRCLAISTLSNTVMDFHSRIFWNVRAMPIFVSLSGVGSSTALYSPMCLPLYWRRSLPLGWFSTTLFPLNSTCPLVGAYTPVITLNAVVLPAPLGPISATISPSLTSMLRSSTATTPPNCMVTCSTRSTFFISAIMPHRLSPLYRRTAS